jgi:hypothetical protein
MVTGMVKIVKIGLTTAFKNANTTATNKAGKYPCKCTPGKICATIKTAKADTINLIIKFMMIV